MIKWRLSLKYLSSSCYNALRSSNVIQLPSERTLRDYRKAQPVLVLMLINKFLVRLTWKTVLIIIVTFGIAMDECKIKEDLIYNKHTGELIGYTDLGGIDNYLHALENFNEGEAPKKSLQLMLMVMVRGLFTSFKFPYAVFY